MPALHGRQPGVIAARHPLGDGIAAAPSRRMGGILVGLAGGHGEQRFGMRHRGRSVALRAADLCQLAVFVRGERAYGLLLPA